KESLVSRSVLRLLAFLALLAVLLLLTPPSTAAPGEAPIIVLANGILHDGTGAPGKQGHLVLQGERILAVGQVPIPDGARVIDVRGMIVAPGFIDLHTHSDDGMIDPGT